LPCTAPWARAWRSVASADGAAHEALRQQFLKPLEVGRRQIALGLRRAHLGLRRLAGER